MSDYEHAYPSNKNSAPSSLKKKSRSTAIPNKTKTWKKKSRQANIQFLLWKRKHFPLHFSIERKKSFFSDFKKWQF